MKHSDFIKHFSRSTFNLKNTEYDCFSEVITNDSIKNITIYQRNLFGLLFDQLSESYLGCFTYLESGNFNFLVRQFILQKGVNAPDISEVCMSFSSFLNELLELHQDEVLIQLAKIDWLWSFGKNGDTTDTGKNSVFYWQKTIDHQDVKNINIDLNQLDTVKIKYIDGEKVLSLIKGTINDQ